MARKEPVNYAPPKAKRGFFRDLLPVLSYGVPMVVGAIWIALLLEQLSPILSR